MTENRITEVRSAFTGWIKVMIAKVTSTSGAAFEREIEDHGTAVAVLPYDAGRRVALAISQFRVPVEYRFPGSPHIVEPIAGVNDEGDSENCARREAMEEAGVRLSVLENVATCWSMPGISTEMITLFLAPYNSDDRVSQGGGLASENEEIHVHEWPLAELWQYVSTAPSVDMKLLVLIQALKDRHPCLFTG